MSLYEYQGQAHSLTLVQGHLDSTFSNFFSLETTRLIEAKFHVEPPWDGEMKTSTDGLYHMTKMATMPIYGKNLTWNEKLITLKLGMRHWFFKYYQYFIKWWPCVDRDLFYTKVKFGLLCFYMEKNCYKVI